MAEVQVVNSSARVVEEVQNVTVLGQAAAHVEVQTVTVDTSSGAATGTYTLTNPATGQSAAVAYSWTGSNAQQMRSSLATIGLAKAIVAYSAAGSKRLWTVRFDGTAGDQQQLTGTVAAGKSPVAVATTLQGTVHEVQRLRLVTPTQTASLAHQRFQLKFRGRETAPLPYSASAAMVAEALGRLDTVGKVAVTKASKEVPYPMHIR